MQSKLLSITGKEKMLVILHMDLQLTNRGLVDMSQPAKINIGNFPIPITREQNIADSDLEVKVNLFMKHEENTDEIGMGIKIRQLEYLFGQAKHGGYTHLIVDGVMESHCCTAVAHYADRFGLKPVLVIKDDKPDLIMDNHKKMADSGADIYYIGKNPKPAELEKIKQEISAYYIARG